MIYAQVSSRGRTPSKFFIALLAIIGIGVLLGAASASAAHVQVGTFAGGGPGIGGSGSADGQLSNPGQADVYDATGYLYLADTANNRVEVFKPTATAGEYDSQVAINEPTGLAIDEATGDVYVSNATGISKFTSALVPIVGPAWTNPAVGGPLAVDPSTGDLLVADTAAGLVRRYNSDGSADGSFAAERPTDLAADSTGDIVVVTSTGNVVTECAATSAVKRFSAAGIEEDTIGASLSAPGAVAVDPDDDSVVIASRVNQWNCGPETPLVSFFDASDAPQEEVGLAADTQYAMVPGLAAAGGSSRVYAVTKSPFNDEFGATKVTALEIPPPVAPTVVSQSVLPGGVDATLQARIRPGGLTTTYHFEYGLTAGYGESTPSQTIAAGTDPVNISADIAGLAAGTAYHFRVVASNSLGDVEGTDRVFSTAAVPGNCPNAAFRTGPAAFLTDCRAYELVTPPGSEADVHITGGPVTPDGRTVCFQTEDQLLDADPNGIKTADQGFCSWLTPSGWETKWVTGPAAPDIGFTAQGADVYYISDDGRRVLFNSDAALFGHDARPETGAPYGGVMSSYMWEQGVTRWLSPAGDPVGSPPEYPREGDSRPSAEVESGSAAQRRTLAVSADLNRGIFESDLRILPDDENNAPDIYEWSPDGLSIVSRDASGKAAGGRAGIRVGSQFAAPPGAISDDGSRVFFQHDGAPLAGTVAEAPEGPDPDLVLSGFQSVYMREGDEIILVSPRRGSGPDSSVWFVGATADGNVAYLETTQQLTPEAKEPGSAIYRYDVETDQLELVADGPGGVRFLTLSPDGSTILYCDSASNALILERDGVASTLGTLATSDIEAEQGVASTRVDARMLRVSPDGRVVVFAASGEIAGTGPGPRQIYRWEAGDGLERISAADGAEPQASASITAYAALIANDREELFAQHGARSNTGRVMSDDGSRVFFETTEALVKRDVNGLTDVYEWHDGSIDLVSTGVGGKSFYHGNSADGKTVFFTTFDRLLPQSDRNAKRDLYVARPDGGFPPPSPPPDCAGEACQAAQSAPPPSATGAASSDGNLKRGLGGARIAKGGKVIQVTVLAPGRVTAMLTGKLGKGKPRVVSKASKTARKAGTLNLPLKLTPKAKKALSHRGRLRLTLAVTHSESGQRLTRKVTLHD